MMPTLSRMRSRRLCVATMDLPDAMVLPTLLSRIAVLPVSKQRMMLVCLSKIEKEEPGVLEPEWLSKLELGDSKPPPPVLPQSEVLQPKSITSAAELPVDVVSAPETGQTRAAEAVVPATDAAVAIEPLVPSTTRLVLRVLSTYGTSTSIGLNEVSMCRLQL